MAIVIVPPNNPSIAWAATLDPGHHSFSKWAIGKVEKTFKRTKNCILLCAILDFMTSYCFRYYQEAYVSFATA